MCRVDMAVSFDGILQMFAPKIVVMYVLSVLAVFFYLSKFPECWYPGWLASLIL